MTEVVHGRAELRKALGHGAVGLVPTMGALHAGHVALLERARPADDVVVVTVFVNPLQFTDPADLERYPRTLDADVEAAERAGADLVWAPAVEDVYPAGLPRITVDPGPLGARLEGASRPGHFAGALTVVAKLFGLVRPDRAYFGEKDYQQLVLVRRMAADLEQQVDVVGVPTVREPDGLALSSRNVFLGAAEREQAVRLGAALAAGRAAAGDATAVLRAARAELAGVDVDYLELTTPDLDPAPGPGPARLLVAARVGPVRLIDNVAVELA